MVVYYPKIADLIYKDKKINVKVPIRLKLIKIKTLFCEKCNVNDTLKSWVNFGIRKTMFDENIKPIYSEKYKTEMPNTMLVNNNVICLQCNSELKESYKELIKLYFTCQKNGDFVEYDKLLQYKMPFNWRQRTNHWRYELAAFEDNLDKIYESFENIIKQHIPKKGLKYEIKLDKTITIDMLRKNLEDYEKRGMVKRL